MQPPSSAHHLPGDPPAGRAPQAHEDPIRTPAAALSVIELARAQPPRQEIIAFLLDDADRGMGVIVDLTEVRAPTDALLVVDFLGECGECGTAVGPITASSMVIASIRVDPPVGADLLADVDLWQRLSDLADDHGITLLEWFVISPTGVSCPRDILGEPDRWHR